MSNTFDFILLNGRPGGGKSELIDFIRNTPLEKRKELFHIGDLYFEDDFVWLWEKFTEDDIWEKLGHPRLYSRRHELGYVQFDDQKSDHPLVELCCEKFNIALKKNYLDKKDFDLENNTVFVEFARGMADGGYKSVYDRLEDEILRRSAILYVQVSFAESKRKNDARYKEWAKGSILSHSLPEESLLRFSESDDWEELTGGKESGFINIRGIDIPFVTMNNEPELKSGPELDARYSRALTLLKSLVK